MGVSTPFAAVSLHAERGEELAHAVTDFDAPALHADGFRTDVDHDETGSRSVGKRLIYPAFAIVELPGFQKDADVPTLALEGLRIRAAARQSDLTHDRMQKVGMIGRLVVDALAGIQKSPGIFRQRRHGADPVHNLIGFWVGGHRD